MEIGDTVKFVKNWKGLEKLNNKKFFIAESNALTIWIKDYKCHENCFLMYKNRFVYTKMVLTERIKWK